MTLHSASGNPRIIVGLIILLGTLGFSVPSSGRIQPAKEENAGGSVVGVLDAIIAADTAESAADSIFLAETLPEVDKELRYTSLSETDFSIIAKELEVDMASIKAVVYVEAGESLKGFYAPGVPVVNFDSNMYSRYRGKSSGGGCKDDTVPSGLKGYALKEWRQLINARKENCKAANLGTFWGMFQIGGFNYKRCGCESVEQFIDLISFSEFEQLKLFAVFVRNAGMLEDLKNKNWASFARKYNGPSYKRRGYDTKLAAAYKKYKALEDNAAVTKSEEMVADPVADELDKRN